MRGADAPGPLYDAVDLGTLGGSESQAYAINQLGEVVGCSQLPDGSQHAFWEYPFLDGGGEPGWGSVPFDMGTLGARTDAPTPSPTPAN